jgi:hypothetical protein
MKHFNAGPKKNCRERRGDGVVIPSQKVGRPLLRRPDPGGDLPNEHFPDLAQAGSGEIRAARQRQPYRRRAKAKD